MELTADELQFLRAVAKRPRTVAPGIDHGGMLRLIDLGLVGVSQTGSGRVYMITETGDAELRALDAEQPAIDIAGIAGRAVDAVLGPAEAGPDVTTPPKGET
jgi:hypothetical protein